MVKNPKILIYTVNLGSYDTVRPLRYKNPKARYVLFTDNPDERVPGWTTFVVEKKANIQLQSRHIKICIHQYIKGFDRYLYLDGNHQLNQDIYPYAKEVFKHPGIMLVSHPSRDCIFNEAKRVISLGMVEPEAVDKQMRAYSMAGMRRKYGLFSNGLLVRDNSVNEFCETWYKELEEYNYRDQLSLPFLIWKHKPPVSVMQHFRTKRYVTFTQHIKPREKASGGVAKKSPKVWYFTPGRGDKNLGRAYNDHCALVPDGDWICIRDGDTIFLNPFWSKQIEDIIQEHGSKYPLISCVTNRLGLDWQLPFGFDNNPNILDHAKRANELYDQKYSEVTTSPRQTAGLFMLFPKSTWRKVPFKEGLTNGGTFVDFSFANDVMRKLGKIGIAQGLYLFHFYRFDRKNKRDYEHLK